MSPSYLSGYVVMLVLIVQGHANPKKYDPSNSGFVPSTGTFFNKSPQNVNTERSVSVPEPEARALTKQQLNSSASGVEERVQRFGVTGYGGGGSGAHYGPGAGVSSGLYAPLKIDIGGVVLGTLIGLGAVLILPKLAHVFSAGYGHGYARSVDENLGELLTNLDEAFAKYNIDSGSCMQRAVCAAIQNSRNNMVEGTPTTVDQWLDVLTRNSMFTNIIQGTSIKQAVEAGWRSGDDSCSAFYAKCDIDKQTILQFVSNMLPF